MAEDLDLLLALGVAGLGEPAGVGAERDGAQAEAVEEGAQLARLRDGRLGWKVVGDQKISRPLSPAPAAISAASRI